MLRPAEMSEKLSIDKAAIGRAFGRAAATYDSYAMLQRLCGDRLLEMAPPPQHGRVLDAGCGSGWYSRYFRRQGHYVTALDISSQMLTVARHRQAADSFVQADLDALPFRPGSFDMVWSNLALQWSGNLQQCLGRLLSALVPGGGLRFSTLLAGSLPEVDLAWQALDGSTHINRFLTKAAVEQATAGYGISLFSETITLHFPDAKSALWSLKGVGASHLHQRSTGKPLTRHRLALLDAAWPKDGQGYRLSYQLLYGVKG